MIFSVPWTFAPPFPTFFFGAFKLRFLSRPPPFFFPHHGTTWLSMTVPLFCRHHILPLAPVFVAFLRLLPFLLGIPWQMLSHFPPQNLHRLRLTPPPLFPAPPFLRRFFSLVWAQGPFVPPGFCFRCFFFFFCLPVFSSFSALFPGQWYQMFGFLYHGRSLYRASLPLIFFFFFFFAPCPNSCRLFFFLAISSAYPPPSARLLLFPPFWRCECNLLTHYNMFCFVCSWNPIFFLTFPRRH